MTTCIYSRYQVAERIQYVVANTIYIIYPYLIYEIKIKKVIVEKKLLVTDMCNKNCIKSRFTIFHCFLLNSTSYCWLLKYLLLNVPTNFNSTTLNMNLNIFYYVQKQN